MATRRKATPMLASTRTFTHQSPGSIWLSSSSSSASARVEVSQLSVSCGPKAMRAKRLLP